MTRKKKNNALKATLGSIASFLFLGGCSHPALDARRLFECYRGLSWYSWEKPYHGYDATVLGQKNRDGEDTEFVLLIGKHHSRSGFFVFTEQAGFFYAFPAVPEPQAEHVFRIDFESPDAETRKIWVRYQANEQKVSVYSLWTGEARTQRLEADPADDKEAADAFAAELARSIRGMKSTFDSQKKSSLAQEDLQDDFVERLEICAEAKHPLVREAVTEQKAKFSQSPASVRR